MYNCRLHASVLAQWHMQPTALDSTVDHASIAHLKYEMLSAFESAATEFSESLSSAFGDDSEQKGGSAEADENSEQEAEQLEDVAKDAYIDEYLELYNVLAEYINTPPDGRVGVRFKLRNNGERSLDRVTVTVYFKDESDNVISEEDFVPVSVSKFFGDSNPLRPGYIWQELRNSYYPANDVPDEWKDGNIVASITDIRFTE